MKTVVQFGALTFVLLLAVILGLTGLFLANDSRKIVQAQDMSDRSVLESLSLEKKKAELKTEKQSVPYVVGGKQVYETRQTSPMQEPDRAYAVEKPQYEQRETAQKPVSKLTLEQLEALAIQPAKYYEETKSRVVPEMLPLFKEESIFYTGKERYKGRTLRFRLHTPENMEPGKKYPLILWLHGTGEAGMDNQAQLIHLHHIITYLTGPKKRDFFLLVPQTPKNHTWWDAYSMMRRVVERSDLQGDDKARRITEVEEYQEDFEDTPLGYSMAMVDSVMEKYPVDPGRVTVSGLSSGGDGVWRALERRPDLFAAAVPLVSWRALKDKAIEEHPILKKIPVWAIYSSDDNGIEEARKDFDRVARAGCNVKKSEFGVCGHNAWTPAMLQADIFSWLLSRGKKDGEYVAVVDASVNPDDMKGVVEVARREPGTSTPTLAAMQPTETNTETTDMKPAATIAAPIIVQTKPSIAVPAPPPAVALTNRPPVDSAPLKPLGAIASYSKELQEQKDRLYSQLVGRYLSSKDLEGCDRVLKKMSPEKQAKTIEQILMSGQQTIPWEQIERWIDELSVAPVVVDPATNSGPQPVIRAVPVVEAKPKEVKETTVSDIPGAKIVEDCDRPWAMTSESLYGMFPADWDREAKKVPDFVKNSTTAELTRTLIESFGGDKKKFNQACESILALENRPMSSPWFETSGGRLRSDIKYSLSAKGKMFVDMLRQLQKIQEKHDPPKTSDISKQIDKTLRKIGLIVKGE